jgi:hypothetical protein
MNIPSYIETVLLPSLHRPVASAYTWQSWRRIFVTPSTAARQSSTGIVRLPSFLALTNSLGCILHSVATISGIHTDSYKDVAHDGSISRLLSILQVDVMVWPGMGSEVVFELYSRQGCYYIRVLWGGQVMRSSNPSLGLLDLILVQTFLSYIDGLIGVGASLIPNLCG